MLNQQLPSILRRVRFFSPTLPSASADEALLARFLTERDEAAFELLVYRHGPMVLGVCRRILGNAHDAEDAFQAAFLTLACKGASIGRRQSVGGWLYTVAYRIALRARERRARRGAAEQPLGELPVAAAALGPAEQAAWDELSPVLDAEVSRLPEKYRTAFVLCTFEGKTNEEAAELLGCPKGTVLSRLSRAREQLRRRLSARGLALAAAPFAMLLTAHARALADVSPVLVNAAVQLAVLASVAKATVGLVSSSAIELAEEAVGELGRAQLVRSIGALVLVLLLGAGASAAVAAGSLSPASSAPAPAACCHGGGHSTP